MTKQGALRTGIQMQAFQTLVSGFPRLWSWSGKLTGVSCEGLGRRRGARQADQWELGHCFFAYPDSVYPLHPGEGEHTANEQRVPCPAAFGSSEHGGE